MRAAATILLALGISTVAGCGSSQAKLENDLRQTGMAYHLYHDDHKEGPPGWDELIAFAQNANLNGDSIRRVRDAGYSLKWKVKLDEAGDTANVVLGERTSGGPKLMLDGDVRP
jgi:hypothetical protein